MDQRTRFKLAYLSACVDHGLSFDEIAGRAESDAEALEKRSWPGLGTAAAAAGILAAPPLIVGSLGGLGLAKLQQDPGVVEDAKADELASEYERLTNRLRRRRYYAEAIAAGQQNRFLGEQSSRRRQYQQGLGQYKQRAARLADLEQRHGALANRLDLSPEDLSGLQAVEGDIRSHRERLAAPPPPAKLEVPRPAADPLDDLQNRLSGFESRYKTQGPLGRALSRFRQPAPPAAPKRVEVFGA